MERDKFLSVKLFSDGDYRNYFTVKYLSDDNIKTIDESATPIIYPSSDSITVTLTGIENNKEIYKFRRTSLDDNPIILTKEVSKSDEEALDFINEAKNYILFRQLYAKIEKDKEELYGENSWNIKIFS